jgi:hypothetical protein
MEFRAFSPARQSIIVHADLINTELTLDVTNLLFPEVLIFRWLPSNLSASACVCSHLIATLKIMFFFVLLPSFAAAHPAHPGRHPKAKADKGALNFWRG